MNKFHEKYLEFLKIWKGAKWSDFVRRSLGKGRWYWRVATEIILTLAGDRRAGAIDKADARDFPLSENLPVLPALDGGVDKQDDDNTHPQDQGNTPWCVAFATAGEMSSQATRIAKREITFDGKALWYLMVEWGLCKLEDQGTYLRNGVKAVIKECERSGYVRAVDGSKWKWNRFELVPHEKFDEVMGKNYGIITGSSVRTPMCDKDWFLRTNGTQGHAYRLIDDNGDRYKAKNSWYRFGILIGKFFTGNFWVKKSDINSLFYSSFVLFGCEEVK